MRKKVICQKGKSKVINMILKIKCKIKSEITKPIFIVLE